MEVLHQLLLSLPTGCYTVNLKNMIPQKLWMLSVKKKNNTTCVLSNFQIFPALTAQLEDS